MQQLLIRTLRKLKLLKKLNISFKRPVNKHQYFIPLVNGNGEQNFISHEEWMEQVLDKLLKVKKGSFIDVGVNVGQTLLKVKSLAPAILYYGFEPNPTCVYYLNYLIEVNKFGNVFLFPVGLSEKAGIAELNFYFDSDTDSAASIVKDFRPAENVKKKVYVPCFSFSEVLEYIDFTSVGIVKIDVEGAELEVIKAIEMLLENVRPILIMELLPVYTVSNASRLNRQIEIQNILFRHRYEILRIRKSDDNRLSFIEPISEFGIHSEETWCDYICFPEELKQTVASIFNQNV